jgi:hypothetical protein
MQGMKTKDAIDEFGGVAPLAKALGISTAAIYQWEDEVPPLRVYQIKDIRAAQAIGAACPRDHKEAA